MDIRRIDYLLWAALGKVLLRFNYLALPLINNLKEWKKINKAKDPVKQFESNN